MQILVAWNLLGCQTSSGNFSQSKGHAEFKGCSAAGSGGGLHLKSGSLNQGAEGRLEFSFSHAAESGGGLNVQGDVRVEGRISIKSCDADQMGGGAAVSGLLWQPHGSLAFEECRAAEAGGLYAPSLFRHDGGQLSFQKCTSQSYGGCLHAGTFLQSGGDARFMNCKSESGGGALYSGRGAVVLSSSISFSDSSVVEGSGGCVLIEHGNLTQRGGRARFNASGSLFGIPCSLSCQGSVVASLPDITGPGM